MKKKKRIIATEGRVSSKLRSPTRRFFPGSFTHVLLLSAYEKGQQHKKDDGTAC
jgi:hypothetical protein